MNYQLLSEQELLKPVTSLSNSGCAPRTRFKAEVKPAYVSKVKTVYGALLVFDLNITIPQGKSNKFIFDCGIPDLPTEEEVLLAATRLPAFLIGVKPTPEIIKTSSKVNDTALIVALLAKRVGEIYVGSRQADYTIDNLISQTCFVVENWIQ